MDALFLKILNMSITSSYVILCVILARFLLKKAPKVFSYMLWSVVLFRLICPFSFESIISLIPTKNQLPESIIYSGGESINLGKSIINNIASTPNTESNINPTDYIVNVTTTIWIVVAFALIIFSIISIIKIKRTLKFAVNMEKNIFHLKNIDSPFVFGIIKPRIYLPSGMSEIQRSYIIKHEDIHIKRFDYIIKPFAYIVLCFHWFNPLVWIAFVLMSKDMEMSCDEAVLKEMGNEIKKEYSLTLLSSSVGWEKINGYPLAFGESNVKSRIKNVLSYKRPAFWVIITSLIVVLVVSIGLISNPKKLEGKSLVEKFLKYKTEYVGDNSKVGNMLGLLEFPDIIKYDHFELHTDYEPYGVTVYFNTREEDKSVIESKVTKFYEKNALIMISQIGNVGYINFNLSYGKEKVYSMLYDRAWANKQVGKDIKNFNENEFTKLINNKISYSPDVYDQITSELKAYPKRYEFEDANKDGMLCIIHGQIKSDMKILNTFMEDVKNKRASKISVFKYTIEGDPIITSVIYNGDRYYGVSDYSRDIHSGQAYYNLNFKYLKLLDNGRNSKSAFLTNDNNFNINKLSEECYELYSFTN